MSSEPNKPEDVTADESPRDEHGEARVSEGGESSAPAPEASEEAPVVEGAGASVDESGESSETEETSAADAAEQESAADAAGQESAADAADAGDDEDLDVQPIESLEEEEIGEEEPEFHWYILKVQVNREDSIRDALIRRVKIAGLDEMFREIIVPTEDVAEFNKAGKRRIVKKKLYPGYIMVNMAINDDTWFLVRETPGIGDFTGSAGKPTPMEDSEVERIVARGKTEEGEEGHVKTSIPFKPGDQVRVKDGNFQGFEGDVDAIDEAHGRVTVMINIFGRPTPVELEHWQIEAV